MSSNTSSSAAGAPFAHDELATARGIGIVLVVVGHIPYPILGTFDIYHFHMPAFFMLAGMGLRPDRGVAETLVFHLKSFLLYAAAMCFVYTVIGRTIGAVTGLQLVSFDGWSLRHFTVDMWTETCHHVRLFSVGWFILALGIARPLATFAVKAVQALPWWSRKPLLLGFGLGSGYFGMVHMSTWAIRTGHSIYNSLTQVPIALEFLILGYLVATTPLARATIRWPVTALGGFTALLLFLGNGSIRVPSMAWSQYPSGFVPHTITAGMGTLVMLYASCVLVRVTKNRVLPFLGKHSKSIMAHHLFVFLLVNLGFSMLGKLELAKVEVYAVYECRWTWPLYLGLGIGLPSLAAATWHGLALGQRVRSLVRRA